MVVQGEGACVVAGGMHGCGGHAWLWGACMVVGGMHGCGGVCGCGGQVWLWGAGVVVEGHAWLQGGLGGVHGCGGACVIVGACMVVGEGGMHGCRGACVGYDEIWSMSGRYASYWNAFLLSFLFLVSCP